MVREFISRKFDEAKERFKEERQLNKEIKAEARQAAFEERRKQAVKLAKMREAERFKVRKAGIRVQAQKAFGIAGTIKPRTPKKTRSSSDDDFEVVIRRKKKPQARVRPKDPFEFSDSFFR